MFNDLTEKLERVFKKLKGHGKLSESNIAESLREVRRVLLEADVNYKVAKQFIADVQTKAIGQEVLKSITPGQQVIKIIHDEMVKLLGAKDEGLHLSAIPPTVIMLVGLQGSGKTTFAGKLALYLQKKDHNPILVAADVRRPAAEEQLRVVGKAINVPVFSDGQNDVIKRCKQAITYARQNGNDVAILDTGGRLHIDDELMTELDTINETIKPAEIIFVADGMTGQDAVNTALTFLQRLNFQSVVLTKMDGDARGGAALSVRAVTGRPIKFMSVGEKLDQLEKFHPDRVASRILGMGDIVTLVEKAQESIDVDQAAKLEKKLRRQEFTLEDFFAQLQQVKKMGPLQDILGMIPGLQGRSLKGLQVDERAMVRIEAIINSMTKEERRRPQIINGSRRRRIAQGSGTTVQDVNKLLNQFQMMQKMIKTFNRRGMSGMKFPIGF